MNGPKRWMRDARRLVSRLPSLSMRGAPDAPALPVRDPWPGDPSRGARLLRGEVEMTSGVRTLRAGVWSDTAGPADLRAGTHGFTWLRDLRALGTDGARICARALVADWISAHPLDPMAHRPDVAGARIAAWLGHYDFFAASADDAFRSRMMSRLVADTRRLAAAAAGLALSLFAAAAGGRGDGRLQARRRRAGEHQRAGL